MLNIDTRSFIGQTLMSIVSCLRTVHKAFVVHQVKICFDPDQKRLPFGWPSVALSRGCNVVFHTEIGLSVCHCKSLSFIFSYLRARLELTRIKIFIGLYSTGKLLALLGNITKVTACGKRTCLLR